MISSLRRHSRFLAAFAFGAAVYVLAFALPIARPMQVLLGVNCFFLAYLALTFRLAYATTSADLKRVAEADDEGIILIVLLAIGAVLISLGTIIWVLNGEKIVPLQAGFALSAVPLGWGSVHTLAGFRYAHLFYSTKSDGGLKFPGTNRPGIWDFLYLSFGIGMTAQVSDVQVTETGIRKMVLWHSIGAFFYNTIILALAVNAGLALGS
jgi:uncharacterized membrane protein